MANRQKELRCIHRHSIQTHPNCFKEGRIDYDFQDDREFERLTGIPWYEFKDEKGEPYYRIGTFDIEVDNLKPDFGTVLTWAIKEMNGGTIYSVIEQEELLNGTLDKRVVGEFVDALDDFDILIGYYSTRMDFPYMRAKTLHHGFEFPGFVMKQNHLGKYYSRPEKIHWDLYYVVRNKLGLSRNSLMNACRYLGIEGKTPIDPAIWTRGKYGDKEALAEILKHNIADVEITEELFKRLQPFRKWNRKPA